MELLPKLELYFWQKANLVQGNESNHCLNLTDKRFIEILNRDVHPLLDSKKVVPIDVNYGKDFNLLIVYRAYTPVR